MDYSLHSFSALISALLKTTTEDAEVESALMLENLYGKLLEQLRTEKAHTNTRHTSLSGGVALSSQHALDCLRDPLRTVRFIKAMNVAIQDSFVQFPNTTIEILYAGCGPVAPIIIPLLHLYDPEKLQITLLDITPTSQKTVSALIEVLRAETYFKPFQLNDAITYQHVAENPLHIIVSEVMDKALTREPQVRVTQNLTAQLHSGGIFIPERITVFQEFSFYGNEPYFDIYKNVLELKPPYETIGRCKLFHIDKDISNMPPFSYTSEAITTPSDFSTHPDVCIYAEVIIYKKFRLKKSQSLLSNPICVFSLHNMKTKRFQLTYTTHINPDWQLIEID